MEKYKDTKLDTKAAEASLRALEKRQSRRIGMNNDKETSKVNKDKAKKQILLIDDDEHVYLSIKMIFQDQ